MSVGSLGIMLPYWGDPALLELAVNSVREQTDPSWTLTIVDDCYPDPIVADRYADDPDPRIRYVRNATNLGIAGNFERCRQLAVEDLVMFLGCDDLMHPNFVSRARHLLEVFPQAAILQMGVRVIDESGADALPLADRVKGYLRPRRASTSEMSGQALATSLLRGNWLYWPSLVFRRAWLKERTFRRDLPIVLDLALVMDIVRDGGSLVLDPQVTFSYRRHSASLSSEAVLDGSRLEDDRRYFGEISAQLRVQGWTRAARTARRRWVSRLHALALAPTAMRHPSRLQAMKQVWAHLTR